MPAAARPWNLPPPLRRSKPLSTPQPSPQLASEPAVRVAVVGGGAFGKNHLRVYRELEAMHPGEVGLAALIEPDPTRRNELTTFFNIPSFASLDEALASGTLINAASVCVPTVHHAAIAEQLLAGDIDVLIEKPFATSLDEAGRVIALAERRERILQIGHLERFNPAVTAAAQRITRPMFFEAHRLSIFTPRSLDVDVVLDLMIHDLDIVLSLTNSPVREVRAVGLPVLSPKVDIANVRVEFDSGCVANFTASRVSTERVRKLRFFQPQQYISLDYTRQDVVAFNVAADGADSAQMLEQASHPSGPQIKITKPEVVKEEPLHAEICAFLNSVRSHNAPVVPLEDGRRALAVALDILAQIREHGRRIDLEKLR